MSAEQARREDLIVGAIGLILMIVLLELPWYTTAGGTVSGISLPSISNPATGSPDAILGVLAVLATLAVVLDVVFLRLSPDTRIPAIGDNRSFTRFVLACFAAALLALKFILHLSQIGNLGVGFWLAVPLTVAFVFMANQARREESEKERVAVVKAARAEESEGEEEEPEGAGEPEAAEEPERQGEPRGNDGGHPAKTPESEHEDEPQGRTESDSEAQETSGRSSP